MAYYDCPVFGFAFSDSENQKFYYTGKIGRECFSTDESLAVTKMTIEEIKEEAKMAEALGYLTEGDHKFVIRRDWQGHVFETTANPFTF